MWLIPDCVLPGDALSFLVIPKRLDGASQLVLCICLELLECTECLTLAAHEIHRPESSMIINEGDPVHVWTGLGVGHAHQSAQVPMAVMHGEKLI